MNETSGGKRTGAQKRTLRARRLSLVVVAIGSAIFAGVVAVACGRATGDASPGAARVTVVASHEQVIMTPILGAGEGGWCVKTLRASGSGTCPSYLSYRLRPRVGPFEGPIVLEDWYGHGSTKEAPVEEGVVLTTSEVAAVSLEGRAPERTRAGLLPGGLRGVVFELIGSSGEVLGMPSPVAAPRSALTALDSSGALIPQTRVPGPPLEFRVPSRSWERLAKVPSGVCGIDVHGVPGLVAEGGGVMIAVRPHANVRGREFVDCLRASYLADNWPLEVDVLLDAAHPGVTPAALPAMRPVTGRPGVFQGPGGEGEEVTRRIPGAWIIVAKGSGLQQRLSVLGRVRARVRL